MAISADSKSAGSNTMGVQVPPPAPPHKIKFQGSTCFFAGGLAAKGSARQFGAFLDADQTEALGMVVCRDGVEFKTPTLVRNFECDGGRIGREGKGCDRNAGVLDDVKEKFTCRRVQECHQGLGKAVRHLHGGHRHRERFLRSDSACLRTVMSVNMEKAPVMCPEASLVGVADVRVNVLAPFFLRKHRSQRISSPRASPHISQAPR